MGDQTTGLLSPFLREKRIRMAVPFLDGYVLDYGCGTGALAKHVSSSNYLGIDIDEESIKAAKENFPEHSFILIDKGDLKKIKKFREKFDTIVALAVIEHVKDPALFLSELSFYLDKSGKIVLTTPHPIGRIVYEVGAFGGVFSRHAADDHQKMLGKKDLLKSVRNSKLSMMLYKRFLFFLNQLAIIEKQK